MNIIGLLLKDNFYYEKVIGFKGDLEEIGSLKMCSIKTRASFHVHYQIISRGQACKGFHDFGI